ncbi:hypothetical protein E1B28_001628 [Marasmius oreades]|uniref:Transmembrane protein n=1 Tax=Marasmius oreades TaxID=181124 RepID=A0A9P7V3V5_9AGAR|nr:uncharacterized protein E1B28_001628 [Marasmius oreades]KAG7099818.1 hypothetical protein E1B28_001628 [Marasmius oreades]
MLVNSDKAEQAAEEQANSRPSLGQPPPSYDASKATAGDAPVPMTAPVGPPFLPATAATSTSSPSDKPLKDAAQRLQLAIEEYRAAQEQFGGAGASTQNKQIVREQEEAIIRKLKEVGDNSNEIRVREYYHRTADLFMRAAPEKKKGMLNDVGRGLVMLIATPLALCAASIGAVGDILAGTSLLIKGIGKTALVVATGGKSLKGKGRN